MTLRNKCLILTGTLLTALCLTTTAFAENTAAINESINQFIDKMVEKNHFDPQYLKSLFNQIHIDPLVTEKMNKPYEAQPWTVYRKFFITDERVALGVQYWQQHAKELAHAEELYGVPASVIVAIIGVESKFGTKQGDFPIFQSLTTLAFNYPSRATFFTSELENYLLLTREQKFDPLSIKGSHAGAIGKPQFMPSSYRHYAVAFDGGKHSDLINNDGDAISSVANYFKRNGWKESQLVIIPAKATAKALKSIKQDPLKLNSTLGELRQQGVSVDEKLPADTKATFFSVEFDKKPQYWVALNNFQAITRYNHNMQYALAVYEFSQAIENARKAAQRERSEQEG
jgi:membrane-bound lytic murein transglycosylase B